MRPVIFKQEGLGERLQYDPYSRKSLLDHFYDSDISLEAVARNEALERGDFVQAPFEARLRRNPDRVQVQLARLGNAWGIPMQDHQRRYAASRQFDIGNRLPAGRAAA